MMIRVMRKRYRDWSNMIQKNIKDILEREVFGISTVFLAIEVDPYYGLIYALGEENNQIIYVELIFCNYFYDIDYQDEIDIQYLPIGFDATPDNEYRQKEAESIEDSLVVEDGITE